MGILRAGRAEETREAVRLMMSASQHRGPDGSGSAEIPLGDRLLVLGHTRLSIVDLSDGSRQPMRDAETESWLAFNGEIYNFRQLRAELEALGVRFSTPGDSEVLLRALVQWGERALDRVDGMFAFAFWDGRSKELLLARDRVGMKPLYYSSFPREFAFASEVKILERAGVCDLTFDREAVDSFLAYGAVTGPNTIFVEIRELEPGHLLRINARGEVVKSQYWSLAACIGADEQESKSGAVTNFDSALDLIRKRLDGAVASHLVSDVPVGVFLSGGIDSSLLALFASRQAQRPITLLTVAFAEQEFSELAFARQVARSLPQDSHHEVVTLSAEQLCELLPLALDAMDQPTVDGINTFVISRVGASLGLKVLLTGIGGDELFGGYTTFAKVPRLFRYGAGLRPAARVLAKLGARFGKGNPIQWQKVADSGAISSLTDAYLLQRSIRWRKSNRSVAATKAFKIEALCCDFQKIAALELQFYARNQLLRDADVFSMANSVELRVPFLDLKLMEAALSISPEFHFELGRGKRITRRILGDLAGPEISQRRKMGFTFPWQTWLGHELRETIAETFLNRQSYAPLGLDFSYGRRLLDGLERGDRTQSWTEVWSLFVLLNWQYRSEMRVGVEYASA